MGKKKKAFELANSDGATAHAMEAKVQIPTVISREHRERIHMFLLDEDATTISFPPTLNNIERKAIHQYAHNVGMKSQSSGNGIVFVHASCICTSNINEIFVFCY